MNAVVLDPCRQQLCFPGAGRGWETLQLVKHLGHGLRPTQLFVGRKVLPVKQKAHEVLQAYRLDLPAQAFDCVAMDARQQVAFAPLQLDLTWAELAAQHVALCFQAGQCLFDGCLRLAQWCRDLRQGQRAVAAQAGAQQLAQCTVRVQGLVEAGEHVEVGLQTCIRIQRL
ncbi:hypothetical protein D3C79_791870 [compost metagenome]